YVEYKEQLDGLEVSYYVHKKWDRDTVYRSFGKTPDMIRFFENRLGVKFPWAKYAQVTAANFIFGGMENVSATTQTDATLHDSKAHLDFDSDGLVSHELAHMWIGDLVTCRTWTHGWLNEGGASQLQNEWKLHDRGYDEYLYDQYGKQMDYFEEDKEKYRRPIVYNMWEHGGDMFDHHLYPGAAWRYYMLKHLLGPDRWWRMLGEWLTRFAHRSVYTHDFEAFITEYTGEDYGWFFEQWLYKAGYPECKVECSYNDELGEVQLRIEQTQSSSDGITPSVFRFPLKIEIVDHSGRHSRYSEQITDRVHTFIYRYSKRPRQIVLDPDYEVLVDWTIEKPEDMWIDQLLSGSNVIQRIRAAKALGKKATPKALEALGKALVLDKFWGVKAEVAKTLGSLRTESALVELLKGIDVDSTKARTAVARALGEFYRNSAAFEALSKLLHDRESYFVCAAAAASIGQTKHEAAYDLLIAELKRSPQSWHNVIIQGIVEGLVATEKEEAIAVLLELLRPGTDDYVRRVVPRGLAVLGRRYKKEHPEIKEELIKLLNDASYRVRVNAILAAKEYEDPELIPALQRLADGEVDSTLVRYSREAIRHLNRKREARELESLRRAYEELERTTRNLQDRLSKLEAQLSTKDDGLRAPP
ncbi:MAG: M1 family aminopeptidase, partial [Candidatus Thorarchaeota archaeon]